MTEQMQNEVQPQPESHMHINGREQVEDLAITMKWAVEHASPMSQERKAEVQKDAPALQELLEETLRMKGELPKTNLKWISPNRLEVEGASQMTLHSFILKAEQLGKKVKYVKTLTVEFAD